jgi:hypothetical protein
MVASEAPVPYPMLMATPWPSMTQESDESERQKRTDEQAKWLKAYAKEEHGWAMWKSKVRPGDLTHQRLEAYLKYRQLEEQAWRETVEADPESQAMLEGYAKCRSAAEADPESRRALDGYVNYTAEADANAVIRRRLDAYLEDLYNKQ